MSAFTKHHNETEKSKDEWLTPPEIIKALGHFDLDPCAPIERPWNTADHHFTIANDGLSQKWFGRVWMNPPYNDFIGDWFERLAEHGDGIALIFARTETSYWHTHIWPKADAIFFFEGRIQFYHSTGMKAKFTGGAPSVLIAYGLRNVDALAKYPGRGHLVYLKK